MARTYSQLDTQIKNFSNHWENHQREFAMNKNHINIVSKLAYLPSLLFRAFFISLASALLATANASEPMSINTQSGITIGGHDTVAYHTPETRKKHKAVKGDKDLSVEWSGAVWQFTSVENLEAFLTEPDRYRPAYGGHCANALSIGEGLIRTNGKTWEIYENQLFVFYAPRGRKRWNNGNWKTYKADADKAWQEILINQ